MSVYIDALMAKFCVEVVLAVRITLYRCATVMNNWLTVYG